MSFKKKKLRLIAGGGGGPNRLCSTKATNNGTGGFMGWCTSPGPVLDGGGSFSFVGLVMTVICSFAIAQIFVVEAEGSCPVLGGGGFARCSCCAPPSNQAPCGQGGGFCEFRGSVKKRQSHGGGLWSYNKTSTL